MDIYLLNLTAQKQSPFSGETSSLVSMQIYSYSIRWEHPLNKACTFLRHSVKIYKFSCTEVWSSTTHIKHQCPSSCTLTNTGSPAGFAGNHLASYVCFISHSRWEGAQGCPSAAHHTSLCWEGGDGICLGCVSEPQDWMRFVSKAFAVLSGSRLVPLCLPQTLVLLR